MQRVAASSEAPGVRLFEVGRPNVHKGQPASAPALQFPLSKTPVTPITDALTMRVSDRMADPSAYWTADRDRLGYMQS